MFHRLRPFLTAPLALALAGPVSALDHAGDQAGTWRAADSPHVVTGAVIVPSGQSLEIEAGAQVLVASGASFDVAGTLVANGTASEPVAIRSRELQPRSGDWAGLRILGGGAAWFSSLSLSHAVTGIRVEDGASLDAQALAVVDSSEDGVRLAPGALAGLQSCVLERNGSAGLRVEGGAPLIVDCRLRFNDVAARMSANSFPLFLDTTVFGNRSLDGALVDTAVPVTSSGSWHGQGIPFVIPDGETLTVAEGAKLGFDTSVIVKFGLGSRLEIAGDVSGGAARNGSLLFTSLRDDSAGGDTNRDGPASSPAKGDWNGINVLAGGLLSLTGAELRLAGDALRILPSGRAVLFGCELHSNADRALAVGSGGEVYAQSSSFHDSDIGVQVNDVAGIAIGLVPGNEPTGGDNSFHCNSAFNVDNGSGTVLQARRNFWGSSPPDAAGFAGSVDTGDYLIEAPAAILARACLRLSREALSDLRFDWSELSSCASYQLARAERPDVTFGAFTTATTAETHLETEGARPDGRPVLYFQLVSDVEGGP